MAVRVQYAQGRTGEPARLWTEDVRAVAIGLRQRLFGPAI